MKLIRDLPSSLLMLLILTICLRVHLSIFFFFWFNSSVYQCTSPSVCLISVPTPELFPI